MLLIIAGPVRRPLADSARVEFVQWTVRIARWRRRAALSSGEVRLTPTPDPVVIAKSNLGAPPEAQRMAAALLPLLYDDLRRIARRERLRVRAGGTMQTTALVHEAYLKLQNLEAFNNHEHFLRASALAMRHILVSYARDRMALKRGGGLPDVPLDEAPGLYVASDDAVIEINEALERLAALSPRLAQVVECRFFAGYGDEETAEALGLTDRTVRRDWVKARAWLRRQLGLAADSAVDDVS